MVVVKVVGGRTRGGSVNFIVPLEKIENGLLGIVVVVGGVVVVVIVVVGVVVLVMVVSESRANETIAAVCVLSCGFSLRVVVVVVLAVVVVGGAVIVALELTFLNSKKERPLLNPLSFKFELFRCGGGRWGFVIG